jgi:hypothetical protein
MRAHRLLPPIGSQVAVRSFPPDPVSALLSRTFVGDHLRAQGLNADAAEHVTSALVANIAERARTPVHVEVSIGALVRIEVRDSSAVLSALGNAPADAGHVGGLRIVRDLARDWGVESQGARNTVWVELDRQPAD